MTPVCIVTGGAGPRIGSGICRALAEAGWHVVVTDIDMPSARKVDQALRDDGLSAESLELDTSDHDSVLAAVGQVLETHGNVHGLVNSAGIGLTTPADQLADEDYEHVVGTDLRGPWWCAQAVIPSMKAAGGGSIVNIGSVHALSTFPGNSLYSAAKSGLVGLTRGIASDYGGFGIRCNIIHPGLVACDADFEQAHESGVDVLDRWQVDRQLLNRRITGIDIGRAAEFLLSDAAGAITGAQLVVDAGTSSMLVDREAALW
ncbi:MAG: SDR family oxidoreductase [Actinobacteria bacterium]|nr:SDR family oxidoreductase [Actinomycetota bacterium]